MTNLLHSWFTHPQALALLAVLPALGLLWTWAHWRRRRQLSQLGAPLALGKLLLFLPARRRWQKRALCTGLVLLILGIAGPQWGQQLLPPASSRGDIVVVLDVSRSMFAEQPSRLERAIRCLHDLASTLEERGGRRVALIVFASQPKLWFPLTADYEHCRFALRQILTEEIPPALRPNAEEGAISGTRIGAALKMAVSALEATHASQTIILLSDGDDPAGDEEWLEGVQAARAHQLPVHVVGVGDPVGEHAIPFKGDWLRYEGKPVKSRVNEALLQEIARRTEGVYLPAPSGQLPLGRLLIDRLSTGNGSAEQGASSSLLVRQAQHRWFLWPALALMMLSLAIPERPSASMVRWPGLRRLAMAAAMLVLVSAAPPPEVDEWLRQGNAAFARGEYDDALVWYEKAEDHTADPGLVAFNKAAAYFRLKRYPEADLHYQRALEDQQIPAERRARAWFDLGTARVKLAGEDNPALLEAAIASYRACLGETSSEADLAKDARHNLELASLLWIKARAKAKDNATDPAPQHETKSAKTPKHDGDPKEGNGKSEDDPKNPDKNGNGPPDKNGKKSKQAARGHLVVLPDKGQLMPLSPQDTQAHLERLADRVLRERRAFASQGAPPVGKVKDW